jgi:molybdenum cofactor guanylyltransferase
MPRHARDEADASPADGFRAPPPTAWHGAILAGGASRRFGQDKTFATVDGRRLIDTAAATLADAESVTVLLGSSERVRAVAHALPPGVVVLIDDAPERGPLGGLATMLARHPDDWVALLAVDLPRVPRGWWRELARHHRPGAVAIVPRDGTRWEPAAALYHGSLAGPVAERVAKGVGRGLGFHAWLDALAEEGGAVAVPTPSLPPGALVNVNRPEDAHALGNIFTS